MHKFKRLVIISISIIFLFIIGLGFWYKFAWPRYIDKTQLISLANEINNTDPLPENFYRIYDKIYPKHRQTRLIKTYIVGGFKTFFTRKGFSYELNSPTRYIGQLHFLAFPTDNKLKFKRDFSIYFSSAINKYTKPEKCFDYAIKHYNFLHNWIGIENASKGYFNKNFVDLNQDEIIGLIAIFENPFLYNPIRFPDRYNKKINELKNKL